MTEKLETRHNQTLVALAREINAGEETIEAIRDQVISRVRQAAPEIILQGQRLLCAKAHVEAANWGDWLAGNCPKIPPAAAAHYIHRAQRAEEELTDAKQCRLLFYDSTEVEVEKPKDKWPEDLDGLNRVSRTFNFFERHPLAKWPEPSKKRLREILAPVVKELWPGGIA